MDIAIKKDIVLKLSEIRKNINILKSGPRTIVLHQDPERKTKYDELMNHLIKITNSYIFQDKQISDNLLPREIVEIIFEIVFRKFAISKKIRIQKMSNIPIPMRYLSFFMTNKYYYRFVDIFYKNRALKNVTIGDFSLFSKNKAKNVQKMTGVGGGIYSLPKIFHKSEKG